MLKRSALLVAAALPLAACNSGPTVEAENATGVEVAAAVEAAGGTGSFVSPGLWRSKMTIEDISMPGMPPQAVAQMREQMASRSTTSESCLTEADIKKPDANFFGGQGDSCKYDHFTMGGGKIDMQMTCNPGGAQQVMKMNGTYSSDKYSMTASSEGSGPTGAMTMKLRIDSERIGDCTAGDANG